jgi:hypothetical protein
MPEKRLKNMLIESTAKSTNSIDEVFLFNLAQRMP